jgi:hypothetical protein
MHGRTDEALQAARNTLDRARRLSELPTQGPLLYRIIGSSLDDAGNEEAADQAYADALALSRKRNAVQEIAFTLTALITRSRARGLAVDPAWVSEARELSKKLGLVVDLTVTRTTTRIPEQRRTPAPL